MPFLIVSSIRFLLYIDILVRFCFNVRYIEWKTLKYVCFETVMVIILSANYYTKFLDHNRFGDGFNVDNITSHKMRG